MTNLIYNTIFYPCYVTESDNGWRVFTGNDFNGNMGYQGPSFSAKSDADNYCKKQ